MTVALVGGRCWGHGADRVGFRMFESATCDGCGKRLRWKPNRRSDGVLWFGDRAFCVSCARARHSGCPCGFIEEAA